MDLLNARKVYHFQTRRDAGGFGQIVAKTIKEFTLDKGNRPRFNREA